MALETTHQGTADGHSVPSNHPKVGHWPGVPRIIRNTRPHPFNRAVIGFLPWTRATYPRNEDQLVTVFQGRVKADTIKKWRQGKRQPPQWAIDLLLDALQARRAAIDHAIALLKNEKGR